MRGGVLVVALGLLVCTVPAAGHGPGPALPGFVSTIKGLTPGVPGVTARVLGGDDRLWVSNRSGRELTVYGYEGEPYLRLGPRGVFRNSGKRVAVLGSLDYAPPPSP